MPLLTEQLDWHEAKELTRAAVASPDVKRELLNLWATNAKSLQQCMVESIGERNNQATKNWAIAAGIATEKTLLLDGQPTQLVAHMHAHRHDLGQIIDKLTSVARQLGSANAIAAVLPITQHAANTADAGDPGATGQPYDVGHGRGGPSVTDPRNK
jgi:hypothetical protein